MPTDAWERVFGVNVTGTFMMTQAFARHCIRHIEVRVYGSEGAAGARLVEEFGICETLKMARPDDVEFRDVAVPDRYYPPGGSPRESWRTLYYANLTANLAGEVLGEIEGNEGNFDDGLRVQEVINRWRSRTTSAAG